MIWLVAVTPFLSTLLGGWAVFRLRHRLHVVMAFAAGILVATAFVDLIPESIELIGAENGPFLTGLAAIVGYLIYASVEAFIHQGSYEHTHDEMNGDAFEPRQMTTARATLGWIAPAGLIVHSTLDGVAIGLGFEASPEVGVIVTLAVLVHDFADGINIVTVAFAGGHGRSGAVVLLALDAAATIVGILISLNIPLVPSDLGILLGVFGGAFIAIGASHLLPEAQHAESARLSPLVALTIVGALLVIVLRLALA